MQQVFSKEFAVLNRGCYSSEQIDEILESHKEPITLSMLIESEIPLKDKFWFVCKKLATREENQRIAIAVAEIVLPIYEKKYPDNKAPREAIEAAKSFLHGTIGVDELIQKRRNAYAAAYAYKTKLLNVLKSFVDESTTTNTGICS